MSNTNPFKSSTQSPERLPSQAAIAVSAAAAIGLALFATSARAGGFAEAAAPRIYTLCENGQPRVNSMLTFTSRAGHTFSPFFSDLGWAASLEGNRVVIRKPGFFGHITVAELGTLASPPDASICSGPSDPANPSHVQAWDIILSPGTRLLYSIDQASCRYIHGGGWFGGASGWYKALKIAMRLEAPHDDLGSAKYSWGNQTSTQAECEQFDP